jgi:ATP-dependent protease ClpP protease subunit
MEILLKKSEPIYLILNTPGGSISDGLELIDVIHGMDRKVHTITMFAASMGFQIAQNLNDRLITESGILMSHRAKGGMQGEFGGQEPSQLSNRMSMWTRRIKALDEQTVKRTNGKQTLASYTNAYENELWLTSQEAVAGGYADRVVTAKCDQSLNGSKNQDINGYFGMKLSVTFSNCPLVTGPLAINVFIKTRDGFVLLSDFVNKGGMFGTACQTAQNQSSFNCPTDTSLTLEKIEEIKQAAIQKFSQEALRNNAQKY